MCSKILLAGKDALSGIRWMGAIASTNCPVEPSRCHFYSFQAPVFQWFADLPLSSSSTGDRSTMSLWAWFHHQCSIEITSRNITSSGGAELTVDTVSRAPQIGSISLSENSGLLPCQPSVYQLERLDGLVVRSLIS